MSETQLRRIEAWTQVALLMLAIMAHALTIESRLAKVEQKVDDLAELVKNVK